MHWGFGYRILRAEKTRMGRVIDTLLILVIPVSEISAFWYIVGGSLSYLVALSCSGNTFLLGFGLTLISWLLSTSAGLYILAVIIDKKPGSS